MSHDPVAARGRYGRALLRGQVAMAGALLWGVATWRLPTPVVAVPVVLAALALAEFVWALRVRAMIDATTGESSRPTIPVDVVALALVDLCGLVVLVTRFV